MASSPAISEAALKSIIPCHTLRMPSETVGKLKYLTVAKSARASIEARATPAAMEGLAKGKAILKKYPSLLEPKTLADSNAVADCSSNPALANRNT